MWGVRRSVARAAPCMLAVWSRRCSISSPSGLALAARTATTALNFNMPALEEPPQRGSVSLRMLMAEYMLLLQLPMKMPDGTPTDILAWWKMRDHDKPANQTTGRPEGLPHLARMARQYHGEPASSGGAERLFCNASRAHHDLKGAIMGDNTLEHQLLALANTD